MASTLQLTVEFVEHEVTEQRRKWTSLWGPFHARADQPVLHHSGIEECPDEFQQPLSSTRFAIWPINLSWLTRSKNFSKSKSTVQL
jgi:hypothetical protein